MTQTQPLPSAPPATLTPPLATAPPATQPDAPVRIYRHRWPVRVMHWVNAITFFILLMSGLNIFNAHPALYWGKDSSFATPWVAVDARQVDGGPLVGVTRIAGTEFVTTGVLGVSRVAGQDTVRAFPSWATIPGAKWLSMSRHWHFFFAWIFVVNGVAFVLYSVLSRHLQRDLLPTRAELRSIGTSVKNHLLFRHPTGDAARRYNVLQSGAYLLVVFGLLPLLIVAGLAMSPRLDAVYAGWVDLLGGRQSARTLHFLAAFGLVLFTVIHVFEVFVAGFWNEMRSMVTGWYTLPRAPSSTVGRAPLATTARMTSAADITTNANATDKASP